MHMNSKILLSTHSEVYVIDCSTLLYLQAEDHYTHLYTAQGGHMLLPFALSQVVEALSGPVSRGLRLYRMGRTYVLNLRYVSHVSTLKQSVLLTDNQGKVYLLRFSKVMLRALVNVMSGRSPESPTDEEE